MTSPHSVNVPSIRFKGFTDVWEECKLEEICNYYASSLSAKHINNEGIYDLYDANTIIGKTNTDCMKEDYITIIKDGAGVGRTRLLPKGSMFLGTMGAITPRNSNLDFLYQLVSNANLGSLYTGSTIPHIYFKDYGKNTYHVPHIVEQEQIGAFFYNIDHYITFYRYKYDKLQNIKKSMLEKMFPKNGSNIPEIRFAGFTDAWEQRKLGEVATYRRGSFPQPYGKSEWYDGDGAMPFVQVADVSDEMNLVEETKQKISILAQPMSVFAEKNSVLVTLQGSIGRVAIMQYGAFVDRTVLIFEKYKAEIDKTFWAYIIKQKFIDEARKAPGGTIKTITKEALSDFDLSIPKYQEQKQIGAYFRNLDNLITLHQRRQHEIQLFRKISIFCTYADYF